MRGFTIATIIRTLVLRVYHQAQLQAGLLVTGGGVVVGTPTGGDKGAGTVNATTVYQNGATLDTTYAKRYVLADTTCPAGVITSIPHTLGADALNASWTFLIVCQSADAGYSPGDVAVTTQLEVQDSGSGENIQTFFAYPDASNMVILGGGRMYYARNKSTAGYTVLDATKWKMRCVAVL
jgi:hypothetical protein